MAEKGFFRIYRNPDDEMDIIFEKLTIVEETISENQEKLYLKVEKINSILKKILKKEKDEYLRYSNEILGISRVGLVGESAEPRLAFSSLELLENEIINNLGTTFKNKYMINLAKAGIISSTIVTILLFVFFRIFGHENLFKIRDCCSLIWTGSMVGLWISFGIRKIELSIDDFEKIEKDQMTPYIKTTFIGITAIVFALSLNLEILKIEIGKFNTLNIFKNYQTALFTGIIAGISELSLTKNLYNKALKMINS